MTVTMTVDAQMFCTWLAHAANDLQVAKGYLTDLDAAIGDADHGLNIARGFAAVVDKVNGVSAPLDDLGVLFKQVGMT